MSLANPAKFIDPGLSSHIVVIEKVVFAADLAVVALTFEPAARLFEVRASATGLALWRLLRRVALAICHDGALGVTVGEDKEADNGHHNHRNENDTAEHVSLRVRWPNPSTLSLCVQHKMLHSTKSVGIVSA